MVAWLLLGILWLWAAPADAWIFPEHRDIGRTALRGLDGSSSDELRRLWKEINPSGSHRLCANPDQAEEAPRSEGTACADLTMLFAVAGDHSCSPADLEDSILHAEWFAKLPEFVAKLKQELAQAEDFENKLSLWNDSNVQLLSMDSTYLSRAAGNNAHFPLAALPVSAHETSGAFLKRSTEAGSPMNAVGIYAQYHLAAMRYARLGMVRQAILSEAFAIHFLQDLFSSGHYAGTWGDAAQRKGTHDYYSAKGLVTQAWDGERYSGHGDAFLDGEDLRHASKAVRASLLQILRELHSRGLPGADPGVFQQNVCIPSVLPGPFVLTAADEASLMPVIEQLPIPSEGENGVYPPRYRIETGPFISVSSGFRVGAALGGIEGEDARVADRLELIGRLGLGTVGVLSNHSDGAMFVELGLVIDGDQGNASALAARRGFRLGLRMPFWLIPGDLLLLGPVLYLADKPALQNIAISASNGGLLGVERKLPTSLGLVQLMAGRQLSVNFFGYLGEDKPRLTDESGATIANYRSMELDFPLIEYQAERAFAFKLAFDFTVQLGYALEIPTSGTPGLSNSSVAYLRLSLQGIKYW